MVSGKKNEKLYRQASALRLWNRLTDNALQIQLMGKKVESNAKFMPTNDKKSLS